MEKEAVLRYDLHGPFEASQVRRARHDRAVGPPEYEIAESQIFLHEIAKISQKAGRVLVEELDARRKRSRIRVITSRLHEDGKVGGHLPRHPGEIHARRGSEFAAPGKGSIQHYTQEVVPVTLEKFQGFFVRRRQQDFRPGPHAHHLLHAVDTLRHQALGLLDDFRVEHGQKGRIVLDRVFDQENALHPRGPHVVPCVHLVLNVLDNREKEPDVAQPDEGLVNPGEFASRLKHIQFPGRARQRDDADVRIHGMGRMAEFHDVHISHSRHGDEEVEMLVVQFLEGLLRRGDPLDGRREPQVQFQVLGKEHLREPPVFNEGVAIVETRHKQKVADPPRHERIQGDFEVSWRSEKGVEQVIPHAASGTPSCANG